MAISDIFQAVLDMDQARTVALVTSEIAAGGDVAAIVNQGLIGAMDEVGRRFSEGDMFVPEMLVAANAMKAGLEVVRPLMKGADARTRGTVVIGTVKGDLHDIGKNLVAMMFEGAGFRVVDLGVDVDAAKVTGAVREHGADIVALSALLTTTMPQMRDTVATLTEAGLREKVKVMVGGAPVTDQFAKAIGADGYGEDAAAAVRLARSLLNV